LDRSQIFLAFCASNCRLKLAFAGDLEIGEATMTPVYKFSNYVRRYKFLILSGLALIFASVSVGEVYKPSGIAAKIAVVGIGELGFALIIAFLIIVVVDAREKAEHHKAIVDGERRLAAHGFLSYVLQMNFPKTISDYIGNFLGAHNIVRTGMQSAISIKKHRGNFVIIDESITYHMYNAASLSVDEEIFTFVFVPTAGLPTEVAGLLGVHLTIEKRSSTGLVKPELVYQGSTHDMRKMGGNSAMIELRSKLKMEPGEPFHVTSRTVRLGFQSGDELFTSNYLTDGFAATITYDQSQFAVGARSVLPVISDPQEGISFEPGLIRVKYDVLLPGHGYSFWWHPAPNSAA
jgi:hypothetical protein